MGEIILLTHTYISATIHILIAEWLRSVVKGTVEMPKIKAAVLNLYDARTSLNVFRMKMARDGEYEVMNEIDQMLKSIQVFINRFSA